MSSMKYQIALAGIMLTIGLFMLMPGGNSLGLGVESTTTTTPTVATHIDDDTNSFPNPNINQPPPSIPQADLTVNAGAIGGSALPLVKHGDAGVNKGGYAEESADLGAAEAMIAKDPAKALQMVDQHDLDYPRGILDPEARVIRVEAYAKKGDDVKALQLGDDFLMDYPHSPRAGSVVAIVEALRNKLDSGRQP
jgi:TolA-binding protein